MARISGRFSVQGDLKQHNRLTSRLAARVVDKGLEKNVLRVGDVVHDDIGGVGSEEVQDVDSVLLTAAVRATVDLFGFDSRPLDVLPHARASDQPSQRLWRYSRDGSPGLRPRG